MEQQPNPATLASTETPAATQPANTTPHTPPTRPKKKHTALWITLLCILALILALGGYAFYVTQNSNSEELAYEVLENNINPQDYRDYLEKYPNGQHAEEVRIRLKNLETMLQDWSLIALSDNANDFRRFKDKYTNEQYLYLCDIKIDSLDFISAQQKGTPEAFQQYLALHPDGRYAAEASVAQSSIESEKISLEEETEAQEVLEAFFRGFGSRDEQLICSNITATMSNFLHKKNASKQDVLTAIDAMYNEHIQSCTFTVNRDIKLVRVKAQSINSEAGIKATFTVDQHIERDNEGKTFGSYQCVAILTPQFLISSLTMNSVTK